VPNAPLSVVVVVGNPKPASRTRTAATVLAASIPGAGEPTVFDLVEFGPKLLGFGDPDVAAAVAAVAASDVTLFASPTYKGAYTGLLKLFLDQIGGGALDGVVGLPVMVGAGPGHAMAPEVFLRPVLVELGCSCPVGGLYLLDSALDDEAVLAPWRAKVARALGTT
jgi:FMN reductase